MKKYILVFFFLTFKVFSLDLTEIDRIQNWELLQNRPVKVEWTIYQEYPISRAEKVLNHNINIIASKIEDIENYPNIFKRVTSTERLDENIIQVVLNLPFPFSGRDYVINYFKETLDDGSWIFMFSSIKHPKARLRKNTVRLPNAAGMWILKPLSENHTKVIYAWNGELLGNFPDVGLTRAWITQGTEVLTWLDESIELKENK